MRQVRSRFLLLAWQSQISCRFDRWWRLLKGQPDPKQRATSGSIFCRNGSAVSLDDAPANG
jgi:hypothetical protein